MNKRDCYYHKKNLWRIYKPEFLVGLWLFSISLAYANVKVELDISSVLFEMQQAQERTIKGLVVDDNGDPLPGVSVYDMKTNSGTVTDFDGNFALR